MTLKQQGGKRERDEKQSWAEKGTGSISPRKGRLAHVWGKGGGAARNPQAQSPAPLPPRPALGPTQAGAGAGDTHAHWRAAPTATAPGSGLDRLEPVGTGGARPRAEDSQREAAAHGPRILARGGRGWVLGPCPSPSLCLLPGPHCGPDSLRVPETDLGLGERSRGDAPIPPRPLSRFFLLRAAALAAWKPVSGKSPAPLFPDPQASLGRLGGSFAARAPVFFLEF